MVASALQAQPARGSVLVHEVVGGRHTAPASPVGTASSGAGGAESLPSQPRSSVRRSRVERRTPDVGEGILATALRCRERVARRLTKPNDHATSCAAPDPNEARALRRVVYAHSFHSGSCPRERNERFNTSPPMRPPRSLRWRAGGARFRKVSVSRHPSPSRERRSASPHTAVHRSTHAGSPRPTGPLGVALERRGRERTPG